MQDINLILENIVFLELLRRGYSVTVGKMGDKEIDFVCEKQETDFIYRWRIFWPQRKRYKENLKFTPAFLTISPNMW